MGAKSGGEKLRKLEWPARILCSTGNSPLHFLSKHTFASSSADHGSERNSELAACLVFAPEHDFPTIMRVLRETL